MKNKQDINEAFDEAVQLANCTTKKLPPDILLSLYAHYKQATHRNHIIPFEQLADNDLKGAFKYNAIIQVKGLSTLEAKEEYIELVNRFIREK